MQEDRAFDEPGGEARAADDERTAPSEVASPEALLLLAYDELRSIAAHYLQRERSNHTLQGTALVHEAFLRLRRRHGLAVESRAHFVAIAANEMRRILVDHARRRATTKAGGAWKRLALEDTLIAPERHAAVDVLHLDDAIRELSHEHDRSGEVVVLRVFGGLSLEETAAALGVSRKTVCEDWRFGRVWLRRALRDEGAAT